MAACDVPGIKRLLPSSWREWEFFDNIYKLVGVPVVTVQLRYNGWVTELQDLERSRWAYVSKCTSLRNRSAFYLSGFFFSDILSELTYEILICRQLRKAAGLDNLLYTPDADFSCFADLALASPEDYYIEGQGSLLQ